MWILIRPTFKDPGVFAIDNLDGQIEWDPNSFVVTVEKLIDDDGTYELASSNMEDIIEELRQWKVWMSPFD